jgi:glycosyltransferase involved in cell wall biosynthesis
MVSLVFITNTPTPYKTSRFEALAGQENVDLHVVYANSRTHRHDYNVDVDATYGVETRTSHRIPFGGGEFMIDTWSLRRLMRIEADAFVIGGWNYAAAWSALLAGWIRDLPVAVISENLDQGSRVSSVLVPPMVRGFDAYFATSTGARDHLVSLGADPLDVTILPNSVEVQRFHEALDQDVQAELRDQYEIGSAFVVLYVGRLSEQKGVDDLVTAVGDLDDVDTHLLVVGDGPQRSALERRAKRELGADVTFTGKLPNEELPNYYGLADAFVLPTHCDTWGLVLNEAMACETPVVTTTAAGAVGDLVRDGETGLVVPPGSPGDLSRALKRLATYEEMRAELTHAGLERTREYSPEAYATRLVRTVEKLRG